MDIQINLFIPESEYITLPNPWNYNTPWPSAHGQALQAACASPGIGSDKCVARSYERASEVIPTILKYFRISRPPAVIFFDMESNHAVAAIRGTITAEKIIQVYNSLQEYRPGELNGERGYYDKKNVFFLPDQVSEKESQIGIVGFGLPIFNLKIPVPAIVWALAAGAAAYKAATAKDKASKIIFSGAAAIAAGNYVNKKMPILLIFRVFLALLVCHHNRLITPVNLLLKALPKHYAKS